MNRTTRRQLLKASLPAGLAALAAPGAFVTGLSQVGEAASDAGKGLQSVKVGLHCAGWDSRSLSELFAAAHELGYDGVELAPPWQEQKYDMEEVYGMLVEAGTALAPAAFIGGGELRNRNTRQAYVAKARRHARWLKHHGGRYVIYSTVGGRDGERTREETGNIREAFRIIADVVADEGCTPLYHNHHVGGYQLSKRLLEEDLNLLDWSSWRLCVDTGHLVLALTDPVAFVTRWAEKVSWMHCKDVKAADIDQLDRLSSPRAECCKTRVIQTRTSRAGKPDVRHFERQKLSMIKCNVGLIGSLGSAIARRAGHPARVYRA